MSTLPRFRDGERESDEDCLRRVQSGDTGAMEWIFRRYSRLVQSVARRILGDPHEAEDVAQSVFLEIQQKAGQYDRKRGTVRTWILQYAYHRAFNRKKYLKIRGYFSTPETARETPGRPNPRQLCELNREDARHLLERALGRLSRQQRRALLKVFFEGYRLAEWARESGRSYANVRHDYYRGLEKLRKALIHEPQRRSRRREESL